MWGICLLYTSPCDRDGALEIASRCRGTPRIANRMLKRVRDFAQVMSGGVITADTARQALDRMEVDELGLDMVDRRMLEAMIKHYNGGPVGLDTLAAVIGEESVTIEDVYLSLIHIWVRGDGNGL